MQNIIFIAILLLSGLQADTVGVVEKTWVDAPVLENDAYTAQEVSASVDEIVIPSSTETSKQDVLTSTRQTSTPTVIEKKLDIDKYIKLFIDFVTPLGIFIKENMALFGSFLALLSGFFYMILYRPLARKIANHYDEEIEIPQAVDPTQKMQTPIVKESAIIAQHQYSTLFGLINESFLYEKERVLLDKSLSHETQNREVISLEWKFNQILHFSLPKLSTSNAKRFKEGVKELLDEEISRDIMIIALEDIMIEEVLKPEDKAMIKKMMTPYLKKDEPLHKAANTASPKSVNYTSYMVQ